MLEIIGKLLKQQLLLFYQKIAYNADILKLINILVVLIKQKQTKVKKVENRFDKHYENNNLSQVGKDFIQINNFLAIQNVKKDNKREMQNKHSVIQRIF